jgi:uncharacterized protein YecT (DUF1311 family)
MKISVLLLGILLCASAVHPQTKEHEEDKCCCTTYDTGQCLIKVSPKIEAELNASYQNALQRWGNDPASLAALRKAERAWIAYRDANCEAEYATYGSGSMGPNVAAFCRIRLTRDRLDEIKRIYLSQH